MKKVVIYILITAGIVLLSSNKDKSDEFWNNIKSKDNYKIVA